MRMRLVRRLGWGVADQAVSSISNFAVSLVVARELGPHDFGVFSLAFVTYAVVLNASRGLATDTLMVRFSNAPREQWRPAVAAATATAAAVGCVAGLVCVVAGLALPGPLGTGFMVLGVGLPLLMLQDAWRFAFFCIGRGDRAILVDLVWTGLLIGGLLALVATGTETDATCLGVFGASAAVAAGVGLALTGIVPQPRAAGPWLRDHLHLGGRYLVENLAIGSSRQLRLVFVGVAAGVVAVGQLRAAEILMGPFLVVLMGISQVAVPEANHVLTKRPGLMARFCLLLGAGQAALAAVWGIAMLIVLPLGLGRLALGDTWHGVAALILPGTIVVCLGCLSGGATTGLRAMGVAKRSLLAQLTGSALYVVGGGLGAWAGGAQGSAWGYAVGSAIAVAVWWWQLRRAIRERPAVVPAPAPEPAGVAS
ncbi:hypothetical protein [Nocardioides sp. KR10-350]|uniref:hypothetical protein n=1 Tax=Nocardioides cheoyonin TaxID=3156615 RepID=UPI0032B53561